MVSVENSNNMKIGIILSTCIHDIVTGVVPETNVLMILDVVGYRFSEEGEWERCWKNMCDPTITTTPWTSLDKTKVHETVMRLNESHKIPWYKHSSYKTNDTFWTPWFDLVVPDIELHKIPALKDAWEDYILLAGLNKL